MITASIKYRSLHPLKSLVLKPSPSHTARHSDFCVSLGGVLGTVVGKFGCEPIVFTLWGSPGSTPLRAKIIAQPVKMNTDATVQLFTAYHRTINIYLYFCWKGTTKQCHVFYHMMTSSLNVSTHFSFHWNLFTYWRETSSLIYAHIF